MGLGIPGADLCDRRAHPEPLRLETRYAHGPCHSRLSMPAVHATQPIAEHDVRRDGVNPKHLVGRGVDGVHLVVQVKTTFSPLLLMSPERREAHAQPEEMAMIIPMCPRYSTGRLIRLRLLSVPSKSILRTSPKMATT